MKSLLAWAASEFLKDESRRLKRPRATPEERASLASRIAMLMSVGLDPESSARRGAALVNEAVYDESADFEDRAVNVIADVLHALRKAELDPLRALAHARAEYFRDLGEPSDLDTSPLQTISVAQEESEGTEEEGES